MNFVTESTRRADANNSCVAFAFLSIFIFVRQIITDPAHPHIIMFAVPSALTQSLNASLLETRELIELTIELTIITY